MSSKKQFIGKAAAILAIAMSAFILFTSLTVPLVAMKQRAVILMLSLFIIFTTYPFSSKKKIGFLDILFAVISLVVNVYILINFESLVDRMGMPNNIDLLMGALCILLVLEATRRSVGAALPVVTILFLAYNYFGCYIPGTFGHRGYDIPRIINQMYITTEGIFGVPIGVVVNIVFLFILFGSFLEKSGGGKFFIDFAISLAGKAKGGPAKIAIVSSALLGTISGSSIANVVTTGSFTIPLMKKTGYDSEFAGSVEALTSTGGQIMPPIMGAAAFIMAEFTQIPYLEIIIAAALPAILYYCSLYMNVHLEACRTGIEGMSSDEVPNVKEVLRQGYVYIIPLLALVVVLVLGFSPARAAIVSIFLLIIASMLKKETRMKARDFLDAFKDAGMTSITVVAATACAGMIVGTVSMTGLGIKFSDMIGTLAGGKELLGLILTMVACIILGMALPTTANYIVQASITAPALVKLGVPLLAAHLFVLYFGVFADITPPVALASFAASGIAQSDPMKTGFIATKNGLVAYLIPYLFIYYPALLIKGPVINIVTSFIMVFLAIVGTNAAIMNYLLRKCKVVERLLLAIGSLLLYINNITLSIIGGTIIIVIYLYQLKDVRKGGMSATIT